MNLIGDVFPEIPAPKNIVGSMSKKPCFARPFNRQHGKWVERLLQSEREHLSHIY